MYYIYKLTIILILCRLKSVFETYFYFDTRAYYYVVHTHALCTYIYIYKYKNWITFCFDVSSLIPQQKRQEGSIRIAFVTTTWSKMASNLRKFSSMPGEVPRRHFLALFGNESISVSKSLYCWLVSELYKHICSLTFVRVHAQTHSHADLLCPLFGSWDI